MQHASALPQINGNLFLTDGGLETSIVFLENIHLPYFAAFTVLDDPAASERLRAYYRAYLDVAAESGRGFVLDTPTWRANPDWIDKLDLSSGALTDVNRRAVDFTAKLRKEYSSRIANIVLNGVVGPRGDGYVAGEVMSVNEARDYHAAQIAIFTDAAVDMVSAITMTNEAEATGIAQAAREARMPCVISFTVETDGRLPTGQTLSDAIVAVDAATDAYPAYYMINCAHATHFLEVLRTEEAWVRRIGGIRANASRMSHAELDNADTLDDGDPVEFGREHAELLSVLPHLAVFGGCCGTDHRHIREINAQLGA